MSSVNGNSVHVIGIGASAGGLNALKSFCKYMPTDAGLAIVIVQHLDPDHNSMLTELLGSHTSMEVVEVKNKMELKPDKIFIIPPNHNLKIKDNHLLITTFTKHHGNRSAIDEFFYSLADEKEWKAIAIVLSGTGEDGSQGVKRVKEKGGIILVQDPETAEYKRMPESAIETGIVDFVSDIKLMPEKITNYVKRTFVFEQNEEDGEFSNETLFNEIIDILQAKTKNSFHYYRRNTLLRRIERRMGITNADDLKEYVGWLKENPKEAQALFKDLLIGVTGFFREPEVWEELKKEAIKPKLENMRDSSTLRIWVPGCATGQEAYSIAILAAEAIAEADKNIELQVFATDIDDKALEIARTGVYPGTISSEVSEGRLARYFNERGGQFSVNDKLRECIVFSHQNLISDPPFSRIDIISCRNLLIYLEPGIQNQVISLFHFSLLPAGVLLLGISESLGERRNLFTSLNKKLKIYKKDLTHKRELASFPIVQSSPSKLLKESEGKQKFSKKESRPQEITNEFLLEHYSPPSILINSSNEILYLNGAVEKYLRVAPGEPSTNLLTLLREGLTTRMHGSIIKARNEWGKVIIDHGRVKRDDGYFEVRIEISPLASKDPDYNALLIAFFEKEEDERTETSAEYATDEKIINELEYELQATKEDHRSIIEELQTSNEELKSANEEIMTMNEELQSSNEELKNSQEKLQSFNEELHSLNTQLKDYNIKLRRTNDELNRQQELNLLKDQMFAIISHDLRSPLHNMQSYLTILKTKYDSLEKQKVIHMIDMFSKSLSSSISILENLFHWAQHQITDGESKKKEITGREISNLINDEIKALSKDKNIMFDLNIFPDASVYADLGQFTIILRNLISNALKFTPDEGSIKIDVVSKGEKTIITIRDSGIGMDEVNLQNLFDPSKREKRKGTNNEKGFGLGLVFVKEFISRNGGKINVTSETGNGTTFTIELPASAR